jgi:CIC family chloride channel protein
MGLRGVATLPVVDPRTERLLGVVSRAHILNLYERTVAGDSAAHEAEPEPAAAPAGPPPGG